MKKEDKFHDPRHVAIVLNNTVATLLWQKALSKDGQPLDEKKLRKLRNYTQALIEDPIRHMKEGLLRPEELSLVFCSAALMVFVLNCLPKNLSLNQMPVAAGLFSMEEK